MPIPLGVLAVAGAGAAGGGGSFDLLETTLLGSDTASVTFSGLGSYSAYKHLQIRATTRLSPNSTLVGSRLRMNADSGNNYSEHILYGQAGSVTSGATTSQTSITAFTTANSAPANSFAGQVIDILDFSNTNKNTTIRHLYGALVAGGVDTIALQSGAWLNTAAVTSISFTAASGNYLTGSRFSLYGIK
jgi:hypothetical protein